jgi:hypothetical protein
MRTQTKGRSGHQPPARYNLHFNPLGLQFEIYARDTSISFSHSEAEIRSEYSILGFVLSIFSEKKFSFAG